GATPFDAVMVSAKTPAVPGLPDSVAVPLPLLAKVTPLGSVPDLVIVEGIGNPVVWTVNAPAVPTVKVTLAAVVMAGAWLTLTAVLALSLPAHSDRLGVIV